MCMTKALKYIFEINFKNIIKYLYIYIEYLTSNGSVISTVFSQRIDLKLVSN